MLITPAAAAPADPFTVLQQADARFAAALDRLVTPMGPATITRESLTAASADAAAGITLLEPLAASSEPFAQDAAAAAIREAMTAVELLGKVRSVADSRKIDARLKHQFLTEMVPQAVTALRAARAELWEE